MQGLRFRFVFFGIWPLRIFGRSTQQFRVRFRLEPQNQKYNEVQSLLNSLCGFFLAGAIILSTFDVPVHLKKLDCYIRIT